jgi:hypothetical protein
MKVTTSLEPGLSDKCVTDIVELALVLYKLSGFKHHKPDPNQSNTLSSNNVIPNNRTDAHM